jgi:hypothetical protein
MMFYITISYEAAIFTDLLNPGASNVYNAYVMHKVAVDAF